MVTAQFCQPLLPLRYHPSIQHKGSEPIKYLCKHLRWERTEMSVITCPHIFYFHSLENLKFEQAPGDGEGQKSLACCSPWGHKELDTTERLNNNKSSHCSSLPPCLLLGSLTFIRVLNGFSDSLCHCKASILLYTSTFPQKMFFFFLPGCTPVGLEL